MKNNVKILILVLLLTSAIGGAAILLHDVDSPPVNRDWNNSSYPDTDDFPANNSADPDIKQPDKHPDPQIPKTQLTDKEIKTRLGEVELSMAYIRSRIEYKFQTSGRKLEAHWTLNQLVRRKTKLDGEHFEWGDYSIKYAEPGTASIICRSEKGVPLPTGPLVMELTIGSGRSQYLGYIFPTDNEGEIVLTGDLEDVLVSRVEEEIVAHYRSWIRKNPYSSRSYGYWRRTHFNGDFDWDTDQVSSLDDDVLTITIDSIQGQKLANSYSGRFDLKQKNWKSTGSYLLFPALPETAEDLEEWLIEYVDAVHGKITGTSKMGMVDAENSACGTWYYSPVTLIPGDVKITHADGQTTGTVVSSWSRPLPFAGPSYTYTVEDDSDEE